MKKLLWIILLIIFISPFTLIPQNLQAQELDEDELYDNPSAREEWRFQMRRDENGIIPFGALNKAKRQLNNIRAKLPKPMDAGISGWEWLGPGNVGGRIRTILIHPTLPNLMWIGSVSGGIWRTDNAGDSWYPVDDFMANLAVTSIVMDPTNSFIMYAATGEGFGNIDGLQGAGIFKSTDVGNTWNQLSSTDNPQFLFVNRLSHHPSLTNILLAATNTGVYRTVDGGNSWAKTLNVVATQVKYLLNNPNNVLCGTASDFYLSTDGGINWQRETTGATNKMPSSPGRCEGDFSSNGNIVYVNMDRNFGEIWRSTDGGLTWQLRNTGSNYFGSPQSQGFYDNAIWVDPTNSNFVVLSGRNLQRSTDGGSNLTKIGGDAGVGVIFGVHPDIHAIIAHPNYNGTTNKTMFIGCDGGIYATQDITTASLGP